MYLMTLHSFHPPYILSYAPEDVSTLAHLGDNGGPVGLLPGTYSGFDFADAYCPPFNQNAPYSIMGQAGCVYVTFFFCSLR